MLAAVGGMLTGIIEVHLGHAVWPLMCGLGIVLAMLLWLAQTWVYRPFERLLGQMRRIGSMSRPNSLQALSLRRRDEIGQLAGAVHRIAAAAIRDQFEARHLRRTLNHRIETATRKATRQLRNMAMRDPLTDLGNRHFLDENLDCLVQSVLDSGSDLICVVIDMDNFKQVNDSLGHAKGDELLKFLASLVRGCIRRSDYLVRLGGDEFVVLMPDCSLEQARRTTEQIATLFRQRMRSAMPSKHRTDLSMGIASLRRDSISAGTELLKFADANLYAAKRAGKARVVGA
jgi:diguanylate cyclase (GGDEF)-like protein